MSKITILPYIQSDINWNELICGFPQIIDHTDAYLAQTFLTTLSYVLHTTGDNFLQYSWFVGIFEIPQPSKWFFDYLAIFTRHAKKKEPQRRKHDFP